MIIRLSIHNTTWWADLQRPIDISLPLKEGSDNPNCYWADPVKIETIVAGNFIGSVQAGGSVNHRKITLTPHGNGTHTECYGHIAEEEVSVNSVLDKFHFISELISIKPVEGPHGDLVITRELIEAAQKHTYTQALIIRTLPNDSGKRTRHYSGTNPPYFDKAGMNMLASQGISHLITDLPSVDKEQDEGRLLAHRAFWCYPVSTRRQCTITELAFIDSMVEDGLYLLNLQIASLELDASPSKPVLYKLQEVS